MSSDLFPVTSESQVGQILSCEQTGTQKEGRSCPLIVIVIPCVGLDLLLRVT